MAASPQPSPTRLGRYSVLRRLGIGGMAEVFLARSRGAEGVDKLLVAKRILPDYAENPHFRAMFVDEARVALRLNHPNIVQVYGFESDGPTLLLIMEHVDGPDLGHLVNTLAHAGEIVPPPLVAYILREVARGMHYAHERLDEQGRPLEIVHRDVSPNNVLLSYEGAVKLGDFGIARVRSASFENPGTVRGKYGYMAPEQARGESVDRRADIYSLGVLLTELLAGRTLFHDVAHGPEVLDRVREGRVPDPAAMLDDAPEALRAIAVRAMKVDRDERFPTARDVVHALSHYLHGLDAPADAGALEHFLVRVMPPKHASMPPPSGRPPPMPSLAGAPQATVPGKARTPPKPLPNLVTLPAMLMPSVPAPRVPLVDTAAVLRERVHVAVVAGRLTLPMTAAASRALVHLIGELAFKADATLEWTRDDAFVLVLGVLRPHVDDALRAARLALEILDAARSLATDLVDTDEEVAGVMLGMARGVAGCARDAEGTMLSYELVDDAASLASSLAASARAGEALVAGGLYRIVRRAFVLREHVSKGGPSGIRAFALERARSRTERDRTSESQGWRLLGRETPLRELRNALVGASVTRQGRAALVTGELGIGKTTLLGAFAAAVTTTQGILGESKVIRVDGTISAHGVRYGFAGQLVRHLLALRHAAKGSTPAAPAAPAAPAPERPKGPPPLPRRRGSGEVAVPMDSLPQLLDQVSERYGQGPAGRRAALRVLRVCLGMELEEVGAEAATTRELGLVLRPMLADAARERPIVLLLDALEQADAPSRAVVSELLRKPPAGLVLLVAALRDDDPLSRELAGLQTIALGALDAESRRRLIATALGTDDPSDEVVREVSSVAGGNPLTILEVTEALAERARDRRGGTDPGDDRYSDASAILRDDDAPLPPSLEEVLTARLEALSPEARNLLRWSSLCEAELTVDLVDQLGGDEGPRVRARLISDGILVISGQEATGRATLAFAHPMLARVARNSIEPTVVPAMHARVAELLERRKNLPGARSVLLTALARHREAAGAERPAARSWIEAAAMCVANAADPREAMHAYGRVLVLCRGATDVEGYALRAAAREGREDLARASGASRLRRTELIALRELAVEARDPRLVARALTRQARYKIETYAADADRDTVAAVRAAKRAGEPRTEAEARWVLAVYRGRRGMYREALSELEAALRALGAREFTNPGAPDDGARAARSLRVEVLLSKAALLRTTGVMGECMAAAAEAHALAHAYGPRRLLAPAYEELGMACLAQGGYADALRFFRASVTLDRELGSRERIAAALAQAGQAWAALGQPERAILWLQRARDLLASLGAGAVPAVSVEVHVSLAELMLERGDIEGAAEAIEHARSGIGALESRHALYRVSLGDARLHLARRQYRQARAAAEAAERVARESGMVVEALHGRAYAAEACAGLGDRASARAWLDSVLGDPHFADPVRVFRGDRVVAACVRALRYMGDGASAEVLEARLAVMRQRVAATAPPNAEG